MLSRLWCWVVGHRWKLVRENRRANLCLMHLHPFAGCDCDCERCGKEWRDYKSFDRQPWVDKPTGDDHD